MGEPSTLVCLARLASAGGEFGAADAGFAALCRHEVVLGYRARQCVQRALGHPGTPSTETGPGPAWAKEGRGLSWQVRTNGRDLLCVQPRIWHKRLPVSPALDHRILKPVLVEIGVINDNNLEL